MKLTWFGGSTIRVHVGGLILGLNPDEAPPEIDRTELASGIDQIISSTNLRLVDLRSWRPRQKLSLIAEEVVSPIDIWATSSDAILIDAVGEPPLLLFPQSAPGLGRWAESAVIVLNGNGEDLVTIGLSILADRPPRLLALAGEDAAIDDAISHLRDHLDGAGLIALHPGMAVEV